MSWLHTAAIILHVLLAAGIVGLVLLQRGKGADAGAGFGAGASGTVFGARGSASFLSRTTAVLAALFFVTSLTLAYLGGRPTGGSSVIDRLAPPVSPLPAGQAPAGPVAGSPVVGTDDSSVPAAPTASTAPTGSESNAVPAAPPENENSKTEPPSSKAP